MHSPLHTLPPTTHLLRTLVSCRLPWGSVHACCLLPNPMPQERLMWSLLPLPQPLALKSKFYSLLPTLYCAVCVCVCVCGCGGQAGTVPRAAPPLPLHTSPPANALGKAPFCSPPLGMELLPAASGCLQTGWCSACSCTSPLSALCVWWW